MALDLCQNLFPFNILRMNRISLSFINAFILTRSTLGFLHICTRVMALDLVQNFVSPHYLEDKLIEFHQILYMRTY